MVEKEEGTLIIEQKFWSSRDKASRKISEQIERLDDDSETGTLDIEPQKSYREEKGEAHAGDGDRDG